ncbi:MAG TPA: hypothetical protein VK425_00110 [Acidimicrobiales bacterium]|nr:hypothetical protein [Acidimicrobiales bacterium]
MSPRAALAVLFAIPLVAGPAVPAAAAEHTEPGPQILTDAIAAMSRASNFHVTGHSAVGGSQVSVNLSMSLNGGGGTIEANGATLQVVVAHKATAYIKADEHSWVILTHDPSAAQKLANQWIQLPASTPGISNFVELTVSSTFIHLILPGSYVPSTTKAGMGHWDGRTAVVLTNAFNEQLYIADNGTPYLLHLQAAVTSAGWFNFTDFGTAPMPSVPTYFISA